MPQTFTSISLPYNAQPYLSNVSQVELHRHEFQHEILHVELKGNALRNIAVRTGDPVHAILKGLNSSPIEFVGYLHEPLDVVEAATTRHQTKLMFVGPTWLMKEPAQKVWKNVLISDIARAIITSYGLAADVEDSSVVISQITQANMSDWSFLCMLAKRYGYVLYPTGVTVHFHSRLRNVNALADNAITFRYEYAKTTTNGSIYSFAARLSDATSDLVGKARRRFNTVDPVTGQIWTYADSGESPLGNRDFSPQAIFSDYTTPVADSPQDLQARLVGAQTTSIWNNLATAELVGYSETMPTTNVFIENLGGDYDGLWTVLGVRFRYARSTSFRMSVELGTDSLGAPRYGPAPRGVVNLTVNKSYRKAKPQLVSAGGRDVLSINASRTGGKPSITWISDISVGT